MNLLRNPPCLGLCAMSCIRIRSASKSFCCLELDIEGRRMAASLVHYDSIAIYSLLSYTAAPCNKHRDCNAEASLACPVLKPRRLQKPQSSSLSPRTLKSCEQCDGINRHQPHQRQLSRSLPPHQLLLPISYTPRLDLINPGSLFLATTSPRPSLECPRASSPLCDNKAAGPLQTRPRTDFSCKYDDAFSGLVSSWVTSD